MSYNAGHEAVPTSLAPSVPPGTAEADALAAMDLAAEAANLIHAPDLLAAVAGHLAPPADTEPALSVWESEGGQLAGHAEAR